MSPSRTGRELAFFAAAGGSITEQPADRFVFLYAGVQIAGRNCHIGVTDSVPHFRQCVPILLRVEPSALHARPISLPTLARLRSRIAGHIAQPFSDIDWMA